MKYTTSITFSNGIYTVDILSDTGVHIVQKHDPTNGAPLTAMEMAEKVRDQVIYELENTDPGPPPLDMQVEALKNENAALKEDLTTAQEVLDFILMNIMM